MEEIQTEEMASAGQEETAASVGKQKRKRIWIVFACLAAVIAIAAVAVYLVQNAAPKGFYDYTVQKQQNYVEYSDQYDYWDVFTVEYPVLEEAEASQGRMENLEQINTALYDGAMDRVNYWHLQPDDEVKKLQEEYHLFCSDVQCNVAYHSQYLLSVNYREIYAPVNPVWYVFMTQRGLTVDLLTGESYALTDILRVDEDFINLWIEKLNEEQGEEVIASEDWDIFLDWFTNADEEVAEYYDLDAFFYLNGEGEAVVGIALNPKVASLTGHRPSGSAFCAGISVEELTPYRTESVFWERYDKSESTGEVRECEEKHDNLWLGEEAGVWKYWEER